MRVLCRRCARLADIQAGRDMVIESIKLYAALFLLLVLIVSLWLHLV